MNQIQFKKDKNKRFQPQIVDYLNKCDPKQKFNILTSIFYKEKDFAEMKYNTFKSLANI